MSVDRNRKTVLRLAGVVVLMGSLAWASVPAYRLFCQVTGWGGATDVAEAAPETALDQDITVRFDASQDRGFPWEFKPAQRQMTLKIGEEGLAFYEAYNPTDRPIAGTASYNVAPFSAGAYFSKIACFCFEEQILMPGERVQMPVSFFVEPEIVDDPDARHVRTITLSYTFHETDLPEGYVPEQAALVTDDGTTDLN
ncbi:cytochrome c oxidase assembly protein [Silicimonas algicola]|uniref:Cytochrome c oxidase assembly protein CtaG n=1 Tax=Silicimonas algicola TaxID=1826607 RepID=A0A316GC58_9RHOB|nr:cytochrome c oxidase assembly protein [Silicimonas algicola]AZQ66187.1 cytochrome c oxidase assembly protein [Silicimonas algicola]PWK58498.1 cytochrome c oxidase assembly protein subunit 11 [Silicimonas algicola]